MEIYLDIPRQHVVPEAWNLLIVQHISLHRTRTYTDENLACLQWFIAEVVVIISARWLSERSSSTVPQVRALISLLSFWVNNSIALALLLLLLHVDNLTNLSREHGYIARFPFVSNEPMFTVNLCRFLFTQLPARVIAVSNAFIITPGEEDKQIKNGQSPQKAWMLSERKVYFHLKGAFINTLSA